MTNAQKLHDLLCSLFLLTEDLRSYVYTNLNEIYTEISGGTTSLSNLAFSIITLITNRGLLHKEFFDRLKFKFPSESENIEKVEQLFLF